MSSVLQWSTHLDIKAWASFSVSSSDKKLLTFAIFLNVKILFYLYCSCGSGDSDDNLREIWGLICNRSVRTKPLLTQMLGSIKTNLMGECAHLYGNSDP